MPITPGGRVSPDAGDDYDLVTDLAAMQVSNETASANEIAAIRQNYRYGTNAQRLALTGANLYAGLEFRTSDNGAFKWVNINGLASGWRIVPGQVLASMTGPTTDTTGAAGTVVGSVISTISLPVGQTVKIISNFSQYNPSLTTTNILTNWRNNAANVTYTTRDGSVASRTSSGSAGIVASGRGCNALFTTTVAQKVSAGIFLDSGAVYGIDGTFLRIESA